MSAKVPGFSTYAGESFDLSVTSAGVAITLTETAWPEASGSTAILLIGMPADGNSVAIRPGGSAKAVTAIPDNALLKAKRDNAASVGFGLTSVPMTRATAATIRLVASSTFTAVCQWLPVTEPGD
jgi:hypothetical protein